MKKTNAIGIIVGTVLMVVGSFVAGYYLGEQTSTGQVVATSCPKVMCNCPKQDCPVPEQNDCIDEFINMRDRVETIRKVMEE